MEIEKNVVTKTAMQIWSHAQKNFLHVESNRSAALPTFPTPRARKSCAPSVWGRHQDTLIPSNPSYIRSYRTPIPLALFPSRHPQPHRTSTRTLTSAPRSHHARIHRPRQQPLTRYYRPIPPCRPVERFPTSHHMRMHPRPFPSRINLHHLWLIGAIL